ncbi:uncharacterized protein PV09_03828 [Verruconis gallopava]|uniref:Major facilitator superfamily (MFS) profile domain-containing protein n=1 Tax=Verruconis gallopava TaxID=253628 RepID=A0A0D2AE85_9PEZI|nr:uncharacterized protein PV09_03828 [Verruconis gallopava]KIW05303.1 hypothetical protein PV09_03828 [Verruconis gallopava]
MSEIKETAEVHRLVVQECPKRRWVSYFWDTLDKPKEERRFLFKLDSALLTFACLGFFIKYMDQINVNVAFVSGMKEDLKLYKNQLNYFQTAFTVGNIIAQIPSNIILTRIPAHIWIPLNEVIWSVLTFCLSQAKTSTHIIVIRFFVGLVEGTFYPGLQYIIGSWYRKDELAKRTCIFHISSVLGAMFSGYLMAGVFHLGENSRYRGWQWLFIIDGVISLPIALAGFFFYPDVPEAGKPWYLSESDIKLAQRRMELEGRKPRSKYTVAKVKKIVTSWRIYVLTLTYTFWVNSVVGAAAPAFTLFLKASGYSVDLINVYGTLPFAVQAGAELIMAWSSDTILKGRRWPAIIFGAIITIFASVSLTVWDISPGWKWTCFLLGGVGGATGGLFFAWANEITSKDNEERAIVIASMTQFGNTVSAWLPLIVFQQVDAPRYRKGWITLTAINTALVISTLVTWQMQKREESQTAIFEDSDDGTVKKNVEAVRVRAGEK